MFGKRKLHGLVANLSRYFTSKTELLRSWRCELGGMGKRAGNLYPAHMLSMR